jgi:Flp pilus assembly protein TadG
MRASTPRKRSCGDNGVVAIEFALVLPLLLLLLGGVIQFGRAYNAKVELTGAVREGVRAWTLHAGDASFTKTVDEVTKDATAGISNPDTVNVTLCLSDGTCYSSTASPLPPCPAGEDARVEASYDFDLALPFYTGPGTLTINAAAVMRCGG